MNARVGLQARMAFDLRRDHRIGFDVAASIVAVVVVIHSFATATISAFAQNVQRLGVALKLLIGTGKLKESPIKQRVADTVGIILFIVGEAKTWMPFATLGRYW